jgi:hypothetical protein
LNLGADDARTAPERFDSRAFRAPPIQVRIPDDVVSEKLSDMATKLQLQLRVILCRPVASRSRGVMQVLWVQAPCVPVKEVLPCLRAFGFRIRGLGYVAGEHSVLIWASRRAPSACSQAFGTMGLCSVCQSFASYSAPSYVDCPTRTLVVPELRSVRRSLSRWSRQNALGSTSLALRPFDQGAGLTVRQREALSIALEIGFFDTPRRGRLQMIASRMAVSRTAAMGLVRRGVRWIAVETVGRRSRPSGAGRRSGSRTPKS